MITCPNCGQTLRESQRYCGTCGTDVQAALSASAPRHATEEQTSPYAYNQPASYGYESALSSEPPGGRMLIIAGALILAVCCAFGCGLVFGFEIIPDLLGIGGAASPAIPKPTTAPTPTGLLFMVRYLIG